MGKINEFIKDHRLLMFVICIQLIDAFLQWSYNLFYGVCSNAEVYYKINPTITMIRIAYLSIILAGFVLLSDKITAKTGKIKFKIFLSCIAFAALQGYDAIQMYENGNTNDPSVEYLIYSIVQGLILFS